MAVTEVDDRSLGIRHQHSWLTLATRPQLQSAHDSMRWDVSKSRVLSVEKCAMCDEFRRESVQECNAPDCKSHSICERPYR
jgi:hypothetical protein